MWFFIGVLWYHDPKIHRLRDMVWDRQTDGQTDRIIAIVSPYGRERDNPYDPKA